MGVRSPVADESRVPLFPLSKSFNWERQERAGWRGQGRRGWGGRGGAALGPDSQSVDYSRVTSPVTPSPVKNTALVSEHVRPKKKKKKQKIFDIFHENKSHS